ncbi:MAG TPA: cyclase family protein [Solirubrobacteraceae bacterium]|nr:cyclase family protein [Solirubrobacteraceae bacterium]
MRRGEPAAGPFTGAVGGRRLLVYDLGQPLHAGIPCSPNHPGFRMALTRRHGDTVRADGSSAASELIVTGGHVGTHVDALAHVSHAGLLHGGLDAESAQRGGSFSVHGVERLPPFVGPATLLDIPRARGVSRLAAGEAVTAEDLKLALALHGERLQQGQAVLIRTGWGQLWERPEEFVGLRDGAPGPDERAAEWLLGHGVALIGSDTAAFERIAPGRGHALLPVHRRLLVDAGVPILEMLALEQLAAEGRLSFTLVVAPLKLAGATGSPVRPLALVDGAEDDGER